MSDSENEKDAESSLAIPGVVDKYQAAGKIANSVLAFLIKECVEGTDVYKTCKAGEALVNE